MPAWKKVVLHGSSGSLAHLKLENLTSQNVLGTDAQGNVVAGSVTGYTLPTATASVLGGIKVGGTLVISNGVLSARTYVGATAAVVGGAEGVDGTAGYVPAATSGEYNYFLRGDGTWQIPTNTVTRLRQSGGTLVAGDFTFAGSGATTVSYSGGTFTISSTDTNTTYSVGDGGLTEKNFTTALKTKLDGIASSADNYSSWTISDSSTSETIRSGDTLTVRGAGATTVSYNATTNTMTVSSTDTDTNTTYSAGTNLSLSGTTFNVSSTPSFTSVNISGDLTVAGKVTAKEFHTTFVSASIVYQSGSTKFGNSFDDNHDFSGSITIQGSGSTVLDVLGSQGQLFSVTDSLTGTLMSVNDISGLPILEVFDNDKVVAGAFGQNTLVVTGSRVGIRTASPSADLQVAGNIVASSFTGSLKGDVDGNASTASSVAWNNVSGKPTLDNYVSWTASDSTRTGTIGSGQTLTVRGSGATTVTYDTSSRQFTISSTDNNTTYSNATTSVAGLMSAADKTKLDGVAANANNYSLPTATASVLGGIKVGTNLSISNGVLSSTDTDTITSIGISGDLSTGDVVIRGSGATTVTKSGGTITISSTDNDTTYSNATTSVAGLMSSTDKTKLDGIAASANNYSLPLATASVRGGVKIGYTASGKNYPVQLSSEQMYVNVPWTDTDTNTVTSVGVSGDLSTGDIEIRGAGATSVTKSGGTITITSTDNDTTYSNATTSAAGLMSSTDKTKLDGIAASANNYSLPTATASVLGGVKIGARITISSGAISADVQTDNNFTTTLKNKLDGIATSADNYGSWTASDSSTTGTVGSGQTLTMRGSGATTVSFDSGAKQFTISSTDTNTTYSAGTNLSLSGTTFNVSSTPSFTSATVTGNLTVGGTVTAQEFRTEYITTTIIRESGSVQIPGNIHFSGSATVTNQNNGIYWTGYDKEGVTDFSDAAFIRHTVNTGGHAGSVLEISSQNDSGDGIAFTTNASSQLRHNGSIIWDAANDGAGSGLDADLLDGQQGSYYTNASNISSGTLSNERLPSAISVTTVTGSFKGNLDGTATTATTANAVAWNNVTGKPTLDNYVSWTASDATRTGAIASGNTLTLRGSGATTVTYDTASKQFTISSTDNDTTYSNATTSAAGLMSSTDKTKLDGIAANANNYSLPLATASVRGGVKIGYTANAKNYPVQLSSEQMYVNVPWTDTDTNTVTSVGVSGDLSTGDVEFRGSGATTVSKSGGTITISSTDNNTTYSAGTGLTLTGTVFSVTAGTYAAASHTHAISDVTGLQTALNGKQAAGSYLTAEADTLATVTGRGASTSTATTFSGGLTANVLYLSAPAGDPSPLITSRTVPAGQGAASEVTELILFHSNDPNNGAGPDYITLRSPAIRLQTYNDATVSTIANNAGSNDRLRIEPDGTIKLSSLTSNGFVKTSGGDGTLSIDTNSYSLTSHTHTDATTSAAGFMSAADKTKLDGVAASANNYSLPLATSSVRGGVKTGYTTNSRNYAVQLSSEQMYVNVPWTDTDTNTVTSVGVSGDLSTGNIEFRGSGATSISKSGGTITISSTDNNTTYSAGTGLTLTGTVFSVTAGTYAAASHTHTWSEITDRPSNVSFFTNDSGYITSAGTAAAINQTVAAGSEANLVYATVGTNDFFRIRAGGGSNAGFVEIATADDGTEPIYVRQYTGTFTTLARTATILDSSGNTSFPGTVTAPTFSGALSGNATTATTAATANAVAWNNVSGKPTLDNYVSWTASDSTRTGTIGSGQTLTVRGSGATTVTYDTSSRQFTISSTDNNTTYTAGTNLSLSGTQFNVSSTPTFSSVTVTGTLEAAEKSFNIPHPTQPGKRLIYGVLEGPEHAVYVRGKINGEVIELPEEWTGLVDQDTITVQLTAIGTQQQLYVNDISDNKVFIKNGTGESINAFYFVQGTRKDVKPLQIVRD